MPFARVCLLALLVCARTASAECVREGKHKAREILTGVAGAATSALITRTIGGGPGSYPDFHEVQQISFSPKYSRRQISALAVGSALGIFIATPGGCRSILRVLPGVALGTMAFWNTTEHALGLRFSYAFAPPIQSALGMITNSLGR